MGSFELKLVCLHDGLTPICAASPRWRRRGKQAGEEVTPEGQDRLKAADQVWSRAGNPHFPAPYLASSLVLLNDNLIRLQNSS